MIDALRPVTDQLWLGLPDAERGRFLRHLRPFWDVHRHRSAPPVGAAIADEIAVGRLVVRARRIVAIEDRPSHATVTVRPRGTDGREILDVQYILDARGIGSVAGTRDPLLRGVFWACTAVPDIRNQAAALARAVAAELG